MTSSLFNANIISSPILLHHNIYKNNNNDNNNRHYDDYEQIQPVASRPTLSRWGRRYTNELTLPFTKTCWEFTKDYFTVCYNYSTIHPLELTKLGVGKHNQRGSASTISEVELKKKDFKNKHFIILSNVFIIVLMYKIFIMSGMNHVRYGWLTWMIHNSHHMTWVVVSGDNTRGNTEHV